jgi:hypothetical protein
MLIYVNAVCGRERKARFEADARIPLDDNKGNQS